MATKREPTEFRLTYKDRNEYVKLQKEEIVKKIGQAQAILLMQKTPRGEIRQRKLNPTNPNSKTLYYLEHGYVTEILNLAFLLNWDLVVDKTERVGDEVIVEGHLEVRLPGRQFIKKYGTGGARRIASNPNQTWADVYNAATSKLLKVCAARLGLGLDLYRHEEQENGSEAQLVAAKTILEDGYRPATDVQKETLKAMKIEFPDAITKQEAADLIRQSAQKGKNG